MFGSEDLISTSTKPIIPFEFFSVAISASMATSICNEAPNLAYRLLGIGCLLPGTLLPLLPPHLHWVLFRRKRLSVVRVQAEQHGCSLEVNLMTKGLRIPQNKPTNSPSECLPVTRKRELQYIPVSKSSTLVRQVIIQTERSPIKQ